MTFRPITLQKQLVFKILKGYGHLGVNRNPIQNPLYSQLWMSLPLTIRRNISPAEGYSGVTSQVISELGMSLKNCPAVNSPSS